ncbi:MAG: transglycosylase domain-containing protein [Chloroflexi bacterium]|nr:transglycosylase domain-containing protein [Chloroflexota bacterium]
MPNTRTDDPTPQGGWHTPEDENTVAPETPTLPGWKVPALATELPELPETSGGWHRPRMLDTTLTPLDETVIIMPAEEAQAAIPEAKPVAPEEMPTTLSPEDALQTLPSEPGATEAQAEVKPAEPLSPEDALSMVALSADEDEEEEAGIRTELLALNMLAGEDTPLRPVEAAEAGTPASADDPAEVARRRLAELDAATGAEPAAASIAVVPAAPVLSGEEMRAQELARRFSQTQEDIEQLRALYQKGTITPEQFEAELQNRMIHDDDQIWWRMGAEDAAWYKYVGDQWTPAIPPLVQGARAGLQTERVHPTANDPFGSTLPYIGDSAPVEESVPGTMPMSIGYTPLPNVVPTEDLDNTSVGAAAFRDSLDHPTVAGSTVPIGIRTGSGSLGYGSSPGIQSAIDETMPPEIDYTVPVGTLAQEAEQRYRTNTARNAVLVLVGVIALGLIAVAAGLVMANNWYAGIVDEYQPQIVALAAYQPEFQTVVIQDAEKREIARLADGGDRVEVELDAISPFLIHAVVSTRNPSFFSDPGWDTGSTISAFLGGAEAPTSPTITQLVARSLVLSRAGEFTDVDQLVVAGELSQRYSKDFILRLFLNEFPFGNTTFGAEAAARFYFQKGASELNLPEAALLAAIMENPAGVDPVTNRGIVKPAIESVFARMAQIGCLNIPGRGQTCVSSADFNTATVIRQKADLELKTYPARGLTTQYPHFVNLVRQQLEAVYGNEMYQRGFTVQTTLVPAAQTAAQDLLRQRLQELTGSGITVGAVMWSDPANGAIRAYIGSPNYDDPNIQGQRDYARDFLQPGGAMMPIVYAAAMDGVDRNGNGQFEFGEYLTAGHLVWDVPAQYPATPSSAPFAPQNIDGRFYGPISAREALANQYAAAATRVYAEFGDAVFQQMADKMGLQFAADTVFGLSTAVGETRVRLKDLMTAYATIANGGVRRPVYAIDRITDRSGAEVALPEQIKPIEARAFSPQVAWVLQNIMSDDLSRNSILFPRNSALTLQGQPNQNFVASVASTNAARTNLWTIGFTTNAVVGVWLGTPDSTISFNNQTGFSAAAPLWNRTISLVIAGLGSRNPPRSFPDPGSMAFVPVCTLTGTAYVQAQCSGAARNELFPQTRQPSPPELGPVINVAVNTWTNLRANQQFCGNPEDTTQRAFVNTSDPFIINWLRSAEGRNTSQRLGLGSDPQAAPTAECDLNTQLPTASLTSPGNQQTLLGEVPIVGQVSVPVNFNRWQLEFAPQGSAQYQMLPGFPQQIQQPNVNSQLALWDTRTIPNGVYSLRMTVISNDGGYVYRGANVAINNPLPTPTPVPTLQPSPFPTFPPFDQATPIPFDPIPTFGASPTPDPF